MKLDAKTLELIEAVIFRVRQACPYRTRGMPVSEVTSLKNAEVEAEAALIAHLEAREGWISVDDRLPEVEIL